MIKLFRKIRQGLLTENKFSKYFMYALGEIILVIIGILIALSINNWNTNKNNRAFEIKMLREINKALIGYRMSNPLEKKEISLTGLSCNESTDKDEIQGGKRHFIGDRRTVVIF